MNPQVKNDEVKSCADCGASVYPEHVQRGLAGHWAGKLLCPHCLQAQRVEPDSRDGDLTSLSLVDDDSRGQADKPGGRTVILNTTGSAVSGSYNPHAHAFKRELNPTGRGASRMRIFHAKLADGPIAHLNQQINEWLDAHPEIEIKFATNTVGTWGGKHPEPNLILTLYY